MPVANPNRAVLDTSIHVAALVSRGPSALLVEALANGLFVSIVSEAILDELIRTVLRPDKKQRIGRTENELALYHLFAKQRSVVVAGTYNVDLVPTDFKDNIIVAAALEGDATHIVSEDNDLLRMKVLRIGGHNVIQIVKPRAFLNLLES